MKKIGIIYFLLLIWHCHVCTPTEDNTVRVAVSANAQHAISDIAKHFTNETDIEVDIIVGSSGKLTAQIEQGAPFDIFISADQSYPESLFKNDKSNKPKIYAYGSLVYWSADPNIPVLSTEMNTDDIHKIAIPNSKVAPYGKAAIMALKNLGQLDIFKEKYIYGENVSQVNQFIISGNTSLGITSKSSMYLPKLKNIGHWIDIPFQYYDKIEQAAVIINRNQKHIKGIELFYNYLDSETSKKIFIEFGYLIP